MLQLEEHFCLVNLNALFCDCDRVINQNDGGKKRKKGRKRREQNERKRKETEQKEKTHKISRLNSNIAVELV